VAEQMLALARKAGADGAEVLVRDGTELEVKVRLGEPELIKEAGSRALGLRVIKDQRVAVTYTSDLTPAGLERLARESVELAARRTVAKLGARKLPTGAAPVVFSPEAGRSLLGQFAGVMSGGAVWRRSTYLATREGTAVASPLVEIVDDPLLRRGPGSRPFDAEGLQSRTNVLVSEGILRGFLCDVYAARKLGRRSTGSASRVIGGGPHVGFTNLILRPGRTPAADIERLERGLYVTALMGFGVNGVTGGDSRGAGGV